MLFFGVMNRGFEFVVGVVTLIVGVCLIPSMNRPAHA
jgi:hypothetical protein